jgi:hypothetical protein
MFVGYAMDHAGDTYHMLDPVTKGVHVTSDIFWLCQMFFKKSKVVVEPQVSPVVDGKVEGELRLLLLLFPISKRRREMTLWM